MTSKILRLTLAAFVCLAVSAFTQTSSTGTPAATLSAPSSAPATGSAIRVGTINIEQVILASNEGQRDFGALSKKLEPKQAELKSQNDELEALQKQLQTQQDKLSPDALSSLQKQIETKKKAFDRNVQDAQQDAGDQQKEIFQRILQKVAPVIVKYAQDNGIGMIVDISNPWPQSPILWAGPQMDITAPVLQAYNTQSGVPAPPPSTTPKPAASKPAATGPGTTPKPAAPKTNEAPK